MNLLNYLQRSIKTRVTLFTLAIFLVGIWSLAYYVSRMLRDDMERMLGEQQFSIATILAAGIERELSIRVTALERIAATFTPEMIENATTLKGTLAARPIFLSLFNGGVALARVDGTVIADVPHVPGRVGVNFADRDYLIGALEAGKPTIGKPVMGKTSKAPVVVMAVPIRDSHAKVIGALAGVIDLAKPSFLDALTEQTYGKTGAYILVAAKDRLVVTASGKKQIMASLAPRGVTPQIDRFIDGFEGYAVYVNARGQEMLDASKRVPMAQWNMVVTIPTAEAFAPIRALQQRMLLATILLTVVAGGLTWWLLRRQFAPLSATVKTLASFTDAKQQPRPLVVTRHDEIGEFIEAFNRLLTTLLRREEELKESENKLFVILESVDACIYLKDTGGRYVFANRCTRELFGASNEEILGQTDDKFFVAETVATIRGDDHEVLSRGKTLRVEETHTNIKDGRAATYLSVKLPLRNEAGEIYALCGISTDITERKRVEDKAHQLAFYDQLTTLPNRRLLEDRLSQAMVASERTGCYGAAMFLDLDRFKILNDTYGHAVGDLLLIQAGSRLKNCVRQMDTVARFGGDEFVVLIGELAADREEAVVLIENIAEKLRDAIAAPFVLDVEQDGKIKTTIEHHCTASIGVTLFLGREASHDDILKWADAAMYTAKDSGRNTIRFHQPMSPQTKTEA